MTYGQSSKKVCLTPGCTTRVYSVGLFCAKCHAASPEGKAEKQRQATRRDQQRREDARRAAGLPLPAIHCTRCVHWDVESCSLGIPEGVGSFAKDCSCYTVTAIDMDVETNHPDIQQMVQDRLERAYRLAGRYDPDHPFHSRYTDVFGELRAKGIEI